MQAALSGRDVLGIAKTGSGKTAAFVLPMVVHISQQARVRQGEGPIGVVLAPTRELAEQIHQDARRCALLSLGAVALCRDLIAGELQVTLVIMITCYVMTDDAVITDTAFRSSFLVSRSRVPMFRGEHPTNNCLLG